MVRGRAADIDRRRKTVTEATLDAVRRGIDTLAPVHGRKSLMLFSEGFIDDPETDRRRVIAASRESHTAVYFVDVRGLTALPGGVGSAADLESLTSERDRRSVAFEEAVLESAGADALAVDTGGFSVRNTNDLAAGAERIAAESRVYYLLGFNARPGKSARDWRKLKVEVKRPGLKVRARRGYTLAASAPAAPPARKKGKEGKEEKQTGPDPAVLRALDSARDETGIPLRALAYLFEPLPKGVTRVVVAAEFDAGRIPLPAPGKSTTAAGRLDLGIVATHRDTGLEFRFDEVVGFPGAEAGAPNWRQLAREIDLPPGVAQVRVVVRDRASGATGVGVAAVRSAAVGHSPALDSDPHRPCRAGGGPQSAASARPERPSRVQARGRALPAVRGVRRGPGARQRLPRVIAGLALRTSDGRLVRSAPPSPIVADADGRVVRFVGIGLDGMEGEATTCRST